MVKAFPDLNLGQNLVTRMLPSGIVGSHLAIIVVSWKLVNLNRWGFARE
jgi:hypothetical protein